MTKKELRGEIRRRLDALSPAERQLKNTAIAFELLHLPEFRRARTVMLFASLPDEVDTAPIIAAALSGGRRVGLPRCQAQSHNLDVVEIQDPARDLAPGYHGIQEPTGDHLIVPEDLDFILVPGLAFNAAGLRLGRGAGYYDRFLARPDVTAVRCSIAFDCQVVDAVPRETHDLPVQIILTESRVIRAL